MFKNLKKFIPIEVDGQAVFGGCYTADGRTFMPETITDEEVEYLLAEQPENYKRMFSPAPSKEKK